MLTLRAALVAAIVSLAAAASPVRAAELLRLDDAFQRVLERHPELAVLEHREAGLRAERDVAALRPALVAGGEVENVLGTGDAAGVRGAEVTLTLASAFERGDKRAARVAVADRQLDALALQREAKRLDLLAEVARRYLDVAVAAALETIAVEDLARRERTLDAARRRVAEGAAPESVHLTADAARVRAAGEIERATSTQAVAKRRLAVMWGAADAALDVTPLPLATPPAVPDYVDAVTRLARSPEVRRFATEGRLREARVQLARTAREPDVEWHVGLRRLRSDDDWGLVGGVSIPLGAASRAEPGVRVAEAELAALELEREGTERALEATLAEAWGRLQSAAAEARRIDAELLPRLQRAERAAEQAYRRGAASYLEWAQLQDETTQARRDALHASVAAHRALIELQRLTGESFSPVVATGELR